jgi:hypothetical protein
MIDWHHLFGLGLIDYFTDSCYKVELEKDLSIKKQRLDVLIIEQESGSHISELPDGLENLTRRNLMTYKSLRQPLDAWALDELIGHYVNYRKQSSPSLEALLPVEDFGLYAVGVRHPEKLEKEIALELVKKGVYDIHWGSRQIRLIVLSEVPKIKRNALWLLFSGIVENVQYGVSQYNWRQPDLSTAINDLFEFYQIEGIAMPYTVEDYKRDVKEKVLKSLTPEELLERLPLEEILKRLPPEELLKRVPPEEFLKRLTREEIEAYLKKLSTSN